MRCTYSHFIWSCVSASYITTLVLWLYLFVDVIPLLLLQAWETVFSVQLFPTQTLDPHGVLSYEMPLNWTEGVGSGRCGLLSHSRNRLCGLQSLCFLQGGRHSSGLKPHEALWTPFLSLFLSLSHTYACTHTLLTTLKWARTNQFQKVGFSVLRWGMALTNQDMLVTLAGSHTCWRSLLEQKRRGLIGISARQAKAGLGTPLVPLAFSTEAVTRRQELHCKTGRSYPPGWVVKKSAYVKGSF